MTKARELYLGKCTFYSCNSIIMKYIKVRLEYKWKETKLKSKS